MLQVSRQTLVGAGTAAGRNVAQPVFRRLHSPGRLAICKLGSALVPVNLAPRCHGRSLIRCAADNATEQSQEQRDKTLAGVRNIVIALDTSKESEYALQWAIDNLAREGDVFHLLHCVPSLMHLNHYSVLEGDISRLNWDVVSEMEDKVIESMQQGMREKFAALFDRSKASFEVDVVVEQLIGELGVGEEICIQAEQKQAAAVIVASHGKGWLTELLVGSISNYVAHHCTQPVLVIHKYEAAGEKDKEDSRRTIAVAVDDSSVSEEACRWTLSHLYRPGDTLHLLHVVPSSTPAAMIPVYDGMAYYVPPAEKDEPDVVEHQIESRFSSILQKAAVPYKVDIISGTTQQSAAGIGKAICAAAEKLPASLLVVGNHTPPGVAEMMMGSVTSYCTHNAACPVAVLH